MASGKELVIKVFEDSFSKFNIRELIYLRLLRDSPGIVKLIDVDDSEYLDEESHALFIILEKMDEDLDSFLGKTESLSKYQVKLIMWQILEAIRDMHA